MRRHDGALVSIIIIATPACCLFACLRIITMMKASPTAVHHSLVLLLALILSCAAETPTATIKGTLLLPDATPVNMTRVALNAGEQLTYSRLDGTFAFYNVPPGVHLVDVYSHELMFGQVKIQLLEDSMDAPKCIEYAYPGANKQPIAHPLVLTASASYEYFEQRPGFSIFSLLKNPMLLMMVFSVGLMYLMPKMMENMDPEEQERMRKQMEMQKDPSAMLTNLFGMGEQEPVKPVRRNKRD